MRRLGDAVLLRSIYRGRVRWCFPHRYAGEWEGRLGLYCQPGNRGKVIKPGAREHYLDYWVGDGPPFDHTWDSTHVLRFVRAGDEHTVELFWDVAWEFLGWYVNLQAPLVVFADRFDTTDWALDIVVAPDGNWCWKDEADLDRAVALGILDAKGAAAVRAEGERVVAERPWPTGWESWRAPPEWVALMLPDDWHVV